MFRQTLLLACLIALATTASAWFAVGERVEGDLNISNQTAQTFETEYLTNHTINMLFTAGESTFTYAIFEVEEDWGSLYIYGYENGFEVTIINYNTTQLFAHATIYGFPPGEAPIDFVPKRINTQTFNKN